MTDLDVTVRWVATLGLDRLAGGQVPEVDDSSVSGLVAGARQQGLVGLLDQAVAVGEVRVSDAGVEAVGTAAVDVAAWCLRVERHALALSDRLEEAGIEHRFMKGFTIAHRFEDHPALRTFADVDVLVRGEDIDAVASLLGGDGHRRLQPEWRPGYVGRWGKSVTLRSADGVEVDLHRTFAAGPYGVTGDPRVLWDRPAGVVALGGRNLPCLDLPSALVHAAVHAVAGQAPKLASLRDIVRLASRPDLDLRAVEDLESGLGVAACVGAAARRAWSVLGVMPTVVGDDLAARAVGWRDRRWLGLYARDASFRRMATEALVAVPGVRPRAEYLGVLIPGRHGRRPRSDAPGDGQ